LVQGWVGNGFWLLLGLGLGCLYGDVFIILMIGFFGFFGFVLLFCLLVCYDEVMVLCLV